MLNEQLNAYLDNSIHIMPLMAFAMATAKKLIELECITHDLV